MDIVLRAQDLSRQSQTWGTSYPVVSEEQFTTGEFGLSDIAVGPQFRSMLRVYDLQSRGSGRLGLRVYAPSSGLSPDLLIGEYSLPFNYDPGSSILEPGYLEWSLWNLPELGPYETVRLALTPETSGLRFWGFVTVTNNETQHVTVIEPTAR